MTCTIEISLYPLNSEYPASVLNFLHKLRAIRNIEIETNGMSTIIIGDYTTIWPQLGLLMEEQIAEMDSVFVLKVAPGRRET